MDAIDSKITSINPITQLNFENQAFDELIQLENNHMHYRKPQLLEHKKYSSHFLTLDKLKIKLRAWNLENPLRFNGIVML